MKFEEYRKYDGLGLAELVKKKEMKASELLEIAINTNYKFKIVHFYMDFFCYFVD
jgi:hypothetical protein